MNAGQNTDINAGAAVTIDSTTTSVFTSGTGTMSPRQVAVFPALFEGRCTGVVELAMLKPLTEADQHLFADIMQRFGQALAMAELRERPLREAV